MEKITQNDIKRRDEREEKEGKGGQQPFYESQNIPTGKFLLC